MKKYYFFLPSINLQWRYKYFLCAAVRPNLNRRIVGCERIAITDLFHHSSTPWHSIRNQHGSTSPCFFWLLKLIMINLYLILYFSADLGEETFAEPLQLSPVRPATTAMYSLVKEDDPEVKHRSLAAQEQGTKRIIRPAAIRRGQRQR